MVGARFIVGRMKRGPMSDNVLWLVAVAEITLVFTFLALALVMI
jgi:hypothetical protein